MEKAIQTAIDYETKIRNIGLISKSSIWKNYKKENIMTILVAKEAPDFVAPAVMTILPERSIIHPL